MLGGERMVQDRRENWGGEFAGIMQRVLDDCDAGARNAFSLLVHNEARRCFDDKPALQA